MSAEPLLGCYDDPELLPAAEALARIDAHVGTLAESEEVALREALGRVLAVDVVLPHRGAGAYQLGDGRVRVRGVGAARGGHPLIPACSGPRGRASPTSATCPPDARCG